MKSKSKKVISLPINDVELGDLTGLSEDEIDQRIKELEEAMMPESKDKKVKQSTTD